ncbi:MAG: trypsin-like peptidase domain-containing protein [Ramlibacter sp.]|nr:trypsin-like peptidase domain-containing protein [Ramlibacter sp.]
MAKATKAGQCGWAAPCAVAWLAGLALLTPGTAPAAPPGPDHSCLERAAGAATGPGFVAAVARVAPAVVNVTVIRERGEPFEELDGMEFFLSSVAGLPLPGSAVPERAVSSGFIIAADGQVLTSAHAVLGAQEAWVRTAEGGRYRARVLGIDRRTDVALLKVDASGLPVVPLAAGTRLCPGEWVGAIGTPFGFEHSVTAGVVSAYPRYVPGTGGLPLIQTDAAINPGSSGGPLFNASGVVVGMNSMIFSALGGSVGLSFALPIDRVMRIAGALRAGGAAARASIGLRTQLVTPELASAFGLDGVRGALVVRVDPEGPAAAAGVRAGDIVLAVNAGAAASQPEIEEAIASAGADAPIALELWRRRASRRAIVVLARPEAVRMGPARPLAAEARLGLELASRQATAGMPAGVYVESAAGSALLAGIEAGDRITAVNDIEVATTADFDTALDSVKVGKVIAVLVSRGAAAVYVPVVRRAN